MKNSRSVFIIDDDKIFRFTTEKYLGFLNEVGKVTSFKYVEDALRFIKEHLHDADALPDIILLDVNIPILDGWDFVEEYKKLKKDLPKPAYIFIVSSSIDERDKNRALRSPDIVDYMVKPINEKRLEEMINKTKEL